MNNIRRIQYFLFCLLAIGLASCSDDDNNDKKTGYEGILTELAAEVDATTQQLWGTSPSIVNTERADDFPDRLWGRYWKFRLYACR